MVPKNNKKKNWKENDLGRKERKRRKTQQVGGLCQLPKGTTGHSSF